MSQKYLHIRQDNSTHPIFYRGRFHICLRPDNCMACSFREKDNKCSQTGLYEVCIKLTKSQYMDIILLDKDPDGNEY